VSAGRSGSYMKMARRLARQKRMNDRDERKKQPSVSALSHLNVGIEPDLRFGVTASGGCDRRVDRCASNGS
jgi:hypothetical protein